MSLALRTTTKKSLVIIDEFGKGTAEADGLSLLAASVEDFLQRGENSPIVFLSTHFASLINYISTSPIFKMQVGKKILKIIFNHIKCYKNNFDKN